ncbi:MAG: hypothetical protein ABWW69_03985 [Pyrodictiaceae archaeon]
MDLGLTVYDVFLIAFFLAFVAVLQFFRGRRLNILLIKHTARVFEKVLRPRDKEYQWIGLYVGYRARFITPYKSLERTEAVVTLMPRHSLFYMPIALVTSRFDRLYMFFRYNKRFSSEAHVIRKHYYRLGIHRVIRNIERMAVEDVEIKGKTYHLVYNDFRLARRLLEAVKRLSNPHIVNHLAMVPSNSSLYVAARITPQAFEELLREVYKLARELA